MSDSTTPPGGPEADEIAGFLRLAGRIKQVRRSGWLDRGIDPCECESVADHTFRVALLAWVAGLGASDSGEILDLDRTLRLALIHDLAEALAGDATPYDRAQAAALPDTERTAFLNRRHEAGEERAAAKRRAESDAFARMTALLPEAPRRELRELWRELEARDTPEARFVKDADLLETYLQSREYAERHPGLAVASFAEEAAAKIRHPAARALRDAIGRAPAGGEDENGPPPG